MFFLSAHIDDAARLVCSKRGALHYESAKRVNYVNHAIPTSNTDDPLGQQTPPYVAHGGIIPSSRAITFLRQSRSRRHC